MEKLKEIQGEIRSIKDRLRLLEATQEEKNAMIVEKAAVVILTRKRKLESAEFDFLARLENAGKQSRIKAAQRLFQTIGDLTVMEWLRKSLD